MSYTLGTVGASNTPRYTPTPWAQKKMDEKVARDNIGKAEAANIAVSAIGQIALAAIATDHSVKMDKLKYKQQRDIYDYKSKSRAQARLQSVFFSARNRQKLDEAQASEQLAMGINHMKQTAAVANAALAGGVDNASAVIGDVQKQQMRAEMYQDMDQANAREQLAVNSIDSQRNKEILYDPSKPSSSGAWTEFGITALSVGDAAYGKFNPVT